MYFWNNHHWVAIYILLAIFMLYKPPNALRGVGEFIRLHFGDSMGIYMLHLSIALILLGGFYTQLSAATQLGNTLLTTAMAILKFTKDAAPTVPTGMVIDEKPKP